ncbi:glycosyltransferase involved in cell wall biosynthesis [Actinoplanes lutulentus]|uniref:Glycosyltransferase involved in cell wall biosynthesis n=1 Tax=Actinoplanes lutulentus TaxID=1287878 RepID=A0A327ZIM3_9ACTN|nr:glycosyltransferase [Actinoplanes lutulentus]RAK42702.1 glycosyltransferase involved in cell wall biosynthesis [Actinoplanes lutulentus]
MNAGPWLPVPPAGYGGIENIVAALVPELRRLGVEVVLASVGESTIETEERISVFEKGQFAAIQRPYNQAVGVVQAHQHAVVRALRGRDDIDLIHDHVEAAGLVTLATLGADAPPGLQTLHWDLHKHPELYSRFDGGGRVHVNGVSAAQLARAPQALRDHAIGHVHLATPLAAEPPIDVAKDEYALVLGRINPGKGQDLAARLAHRHGFDLVLAGPVGPYQSPEELAAAESDPAAALNPDVRFWRDEVAPHVDGVRVRWAGTVTGRERDLLVARARVALFPLRWEEPGGTAVVESLALGTPVVGIARGCLPELIEHGRTGLLTSSEEDLGELVGKAVAIDPRACRAEAERRFTPAVMAEAYLALYEQIRNPA